MDPQNVDDDSRGALVIPPLPPRHVERLTRPFVQFLHVESASGIVLAASTAMALIIVNSPLSEAYQRFWNAPIELRVGGFLLAYPLWYWVNDGLMTIFFFVIGLEIKRELLWGEISDPRKVILPVAAALGGVTAPVAIFFALEHGTPAEDGWAVPMATDIAFVVGAMALLGARVPHGLKILILSLAIVDDILAVIVIAVFYTGAIHLTWLGAAAFGFGLTVLLNRLGVRTVTVYVVVGAGIWFATLKSGVHPTICGVLLGLLTPANAWIGKAPLVEILDAMGRRLRSGPAGAGREETRTALGDLAVASRESVSPLERLERALHPWVGFVIMPVFALANAGIAISLSSLFDSTGLAVAASLAIGKPLGILIAAWLVVRLGWSSLPERVSWPAMVGAGALGGIGFTMSLFIASLGLEGDLLRASKGGILLGSMVSAVAGLAVLAGTLPRNKVGETNGGKE